MNKKTIKNISKNNSTPEKKKTPPPPPPKKKKFKFKHYKDNTLKSLKEVEDFLGDFRRFIKYVKLYKILR